MRKLLALLITLASMAWFAPVAAQTTNAQTAAACATQSFPLGVSRQLIQTQTGNLCVNITGSLTPTGTQDVNVTKWGGVSVLAGNGVTGAGSPRVTIAWDNTPFHIIVDSVTGTVTVTGGVNATVLPSSAAGAGIAPVVSTTTESCHVLKASAGNLYSVSGYVSAAEFIMIFDATSAPTDGAVTPKVFGYAAAAGPFSIAYGTIPAVFATGITVCASSTGPFTKTAASVAAFSGNVQ